MARPTDEADGRSHGIRRARARTAPSAATARLALQAALAIGEAPDVASAFRALLRLVTTATGAVAGDAWLLGPRGATLVARLPARGRRPTPPRTLAGLRAARWTDSVSVGGGAGLAGSIGLLPLRAEGTTVAVVRVIVPRGGSAERQAFHELAAALGALGHLVRRKEIEEDERLAPGRSERGGADATSRARLAVADRLASIGTLAAGLGHDLANVLLPVRAHLHALERRLGERASRSARGHLRAIRASVAYLGDLADRLHHLVADPDGEASDGSTAATDLGAWWAEVGPLIRKAVPRAVRVEVAWRRGLAPLAVPPHALTQAILNLVVNAGEAIAAAGRIGGLVRIAAEPSADGHHARLAIEDDGCGMPPRVRRRAFELFFTTKPRGLGTGLGLPLVHDIVERAGGRIELASKVGVGTTVVLTLPLAAGGGRQPDDPGSTALVAPTAALFVDDGRSSDFVRHLLASMGVGVGDPASAAILLSDPGRGELARARRWRGDHHRGGIVVVGQPLPRERRGWKALGAAIIAEQHDIEAMRAAVHDAMRASTRNERASHAGRRSTSIGCHGRSERPANRPGGAAREGRGSPGVGPAAGPRPLRRRSRLAGRGAEGPVRRGRRRARGRSPR